MTDGPEESGPSITPDYTHDIEGQRSKSCYRDSRYSPPSGQHRVRTHEEMAKVRDLPLDEGLSLRMGMGNMDHSIDDGVEGY